MKTMRRLSPFQSLTFFFLMGLILLTFFFRGRIPEWHSLILRYLLWIGLLFVIKGSTELKGGKLGGLVYTFSPLLFIILIYESLGDLIPFLHPDIDPTLMRIDQVLFGVEPTLWMQRLITPWLTDLLSLAYLSYYFLPFALVLILYARTRRDLHLSIFVLTLGYYVSFIGYILFPAVGPRYAITSLFSVPLKGSFITDFVRDGLNAIEHNRRDCMPSGHTQIALTVLYLAYRYERVLFLIFLPMVCGLVFSTVYLRYHYVIDLMVGGAIAAGTAIAGPPLYRWWTSNNKKCLK